MSNTFTTQEISVLKNYAQDIIIKQDIIDEIGNLNIAQSVLPQSTKKASRFEKYPIVRGSDLRNLLQVAAVSDEDITKNYYTGKGSLLDSKALTRYKNVTQKDIEGGQAYTRGVPVRFMRWLYAYINCKYATE